MQDRNNQRFELDLTIDGSEYRYALKIEHNRANRRIWIEEETLMHDEKPLFKARQGAFQLYSDDYSSDLGGLWDLSRSGIGAVHERADNRKLTSFRQAIANFIVASPCPPLFEPEARSEDNILDPLMRNFVGWYRHAAQENMRGNTELFQALGETMPGFDSIALIESGENARALKVDFRQPERTTAAMFATASTSSRTARRRLWRSTACLSCPATVGVSLFLDEPDNYLSPREVQPWLAALERAVRGYARTSGGRVPSPGNDRLHGRSRRQVVLQGWGTVPPGLATSRNGRLKEFRFPNWLQEVGNGERRGRGPALRRQADRFSCAPVLATSKIRQPGYKDPCPAEFPSVG